MYTVLESVRTLAVPSLSGTAGREKRARSIIVAGGVVNEASSVAYHHALIQLLAELASGFHNTIEMLVQSIVPLDEVLPTSLTTSLSRSK